MKKTILFTGLFIGFIASPMLAGADGGFFPPINRHISETEQRAFIYYHGQTEDLVISTSYQGKANDFAWVIPTPNKPELFKSDPKLFRVLDNITGVADLDLEADEWNGVGFGAGAPSRSSVNVIEQKTVDIFETTILQATDGEVLAKWLIENGYSFPADKSDLLQAYVDKGWYFTVAKIKNDSLTAETEDKLSSGMINPLRLSFRTDQIIYPMKLTRMASDFAKSNSAGAVKAANTNADSDDEGAIPPPLNSTYIPITLYVLTDSKTEQDSLPTDWANWIDTEKVLDLNESAGDSAWIKSEQKLFLTAMSARVDIEKVNDDFIVAKAPNNDAYPVPVYKTSEFWGSNLFSLFTALLIGIFSPIGLIFVIVVLLQIYAIKKKWMYILGLVYEKLACLSVLLFWLLAWNWASGDTEESAFLAEGYLGTALAFLLLFITGVYLTHKMYKRYRNNFHA